MVYICNICNLEFTSLSKLNRHLNNKSTCDPELKKQTFSNNTTCKICGKHMSRKSSLDRHLKVCKGYIEADPKTLKQIITQLTDTVNKQSEQIGKQNEKIDQLIKKDEKSNIVNINNVNNNVKQTQNLYGLTAFGKENLDYLTTADYNKIFKKGCGAIQYYIKLIHCNENAPENRNIYIGNYKDSHIRMFDGQSWIMDDKEDIVHNLFHMKRDQLVNRYNNTDKSKLSDDAHYFFGQKYFENCTTPEAEKWIKEEIKNMLYDNRLFVVKKPNKKNKKTTEAQKEQNVDQKLLKYIEPEDQENIEYIPNFPMFKNKSK